MTVPFAPPFLASEPRATALLGDGFRRRDAWREEARAREGRRVEPALLDAFATAHNTSDAQRRSLAALAEQGTVCVVTGQQIGLFLGPLYTFYKAATCIAWARAVEAETGVRCVPVFWLQTEDHDFAEIAACSVPGLAAPLALPAQAGRASVANAVLPPEVDALVATLSEALAPLPFADEVQPLIAAAYVPGRRLADAFAAMLSAIFAGEGLLVLDPRSAAVARLSAPIYQAALQRAGEVDAALLARGQALAEAGFAEQVHVRAGSPLLFFHAEGPAGPRCRLQRADDGTYRLDSGGGASFTQADLVALAGREPLRFSTSALLRPVVQDALLPSVAYVGGPAELGYLAQTAPLYGLFGVRPALAAPRARFRLLDARLNSLLAELQLTPAQVECGRDSLLAQLGAARAGADAGELARRLLGDLPAQLDALTAQRPGLTKAARRTRLSVERAVSRFAARRTRMLAAEDETLVSRVDRLQAALFPRGAPQERVHSLPWYAARHGLAALKSAVLAAVEPGAFAVRDLTP